MKNRVRIATAMFVFLGFCTALSLQPPAAGPQFTQPTVQFEGGGSPTPCPPPQPPIIVVPPGTTSQSADPICPNK